MKPPWQPDLFPEGELSALWCELLQAAGASEAEIVCIRRIPSAAARDLAAGYVVHLHRHGKNAFTRMRQLFEIREKEGRAWPIGSDIIWGSCAERWKDFPGGHDPKPFYVLLFWHLAPDFRESIRVGEGTSNPDCKPLFDAGYPPENLKLEQFLDDDGN